MSNTVFQKEMDSIVERMQADNVVRVYSGIEETITLYKDGQRIDALGDTFIEKYDAMTEGALALQDALTKIKEEIDAKIEAGEPFAPIAGKTKKEVDRGYSNLSDGDQKAVDFWTHLFVGKFSNHPDVTPEMYSDFSGDFMNMMMKMSGLRNSMFHPEEREGEFEFKTGKGTPQEVSNTIKFIRERLPELLAERGYEVFFASEVQVEAGSQPDGNASSHIHLSLENENGEPLFGDGESECPSDRMLVMSELYYQALEEVSGVFGNVLMSGYYPMFLGDAIYSDAKVDSAKITELDLQMQRSDGSMMRGSTIRESGNGVWTLESIIANPMAPVEASTLAHLCALELANNRYNALQQDLPIDEIVFEPSEQLQGALSRINQGLSKPYAIIFDDTEDLPDMNGEGVSGGGNIQTQITPEAVVAR